MIKNQLQNIKPHNVLKLIFVVDEKINNWFSVIVNLLKWIFRLDGQSQIKPIDLQTSNLVVKVRSFYST